MSSRRLIFVLGGAVAIVALIMLSLALNTSSEAGAVPNPAPASFKHACGPVPAYAARCHAIMRIGPNRKHPTPTPTSPAPTPTPPGPTPTPTPPPSGCTSHGGYTPCDLQAAYALPSTTAGAGQTIAIVDAFNDPSAEADLGVYRSANGLSACTTANGCFKKVDQNGGSSYPAGDVGWAQEISLDVDMVSAICPNCHILLVEGNSNSFANLAAAVDTAARLGANAISNSYGASESSQALSFASHYNHPGVAVTASSGDSGFGVQFPADLQYVTAVGGTSLTRSGGSRGWSETAWSGAGSGCSALVAQPSWQTSNSNITSACAHRAVADVSAVADPNTGVDVYDTYGTAGWVVFGGTSVASPIIASVYGLAANASSLTYGSYPYGHVSSLFDVTSGSNGSCGTLLCTATTGWDGPTGLGAPNGSGAF
jgi:subtilase family serine protease